MSNSSPRKRRFHPGYLLVVAIVTALVIVFSLIVFPDSGQNAVLVIVLVGIAVYTAVEFVANLRAAIAPAEPASPTSTPYISIADSRIWASDDVVIGPKIESGGDVVGRDKIGGDYVGRDKIVYEAPTPTVTALHGLRDPVANFTGRTGEIDQLLSALQPGRAAAISSIGGMGGVGKTELAVVVAGRLKAAFPDAQIVVDMRGTSEQPLPSAEAMASVIRAFHPDARLPDDEAEIERLYRSVLDGKRALLLLDNAASAAQARPLIPPAPCALIVTSRQKIALPGVVSVDLDALPLDQARGLLVSLVGPQRATTAQLERSAELCGRLPLALRIAGSFLAVHPDWTADEYITALSDERTRLARLKQDDLDVEATLSLSYEQLARENANWACKWLMLAVFPATFDRHAAAAVWNIAVEDARDGLSALVERSLALYDAATSRYRLHDLMRLFADAHLQDPDRAAAQLRHAAHYETVLRTAGNLYLQGGENLIRGLVLFDSEWINIQAGQVWAVAHAATDDVAVQLCCSYPLSLGANHCLDLRQHPRVHFHWLEAALAAARHLNNRAVEGVHLVNLGIAYRDLGETRRAIAFYEQALAIDREIDNRRGEGTVLHNLGIAYNILGETRRAVAFYEQALAIDREIGDRHGEGADLGNLGNAYADLGETRRAIEFYEQALAIGREFGDRRGEGTALGNLGNAYAALGETRRAIAFYEQALVIDREIGDRRGEGNALGNLGNAYAALGETRRAIEFHEQALVIDREIGDRRGEGADLGNLGIAYAALGETRRATEFYEQRLVIAREIGDRRGEGNALFNMSLALDKLGERAQAIAHAEAALKIFEQIEDPNAAKVRKKLAEWREE